MTARMVGLFEGYGGLTLGVQQVIDAELVAYSEIEPAMVRLLAAHHPDVPNLGDVTTIDWAAVARQLGTVDIITGGFPCQDVSLAGLRKGLMDGTRSGLWSEFARAIDALRPALVVIENVRGLLSARAGDPEEVVDDEDEEWLERRGRVLRGESADRGLEPGTWSVGAPVGGGGPVLRALGAVLGDLADLGYDARWCGVRASDAGAPHGRFRVVIIAWPADADGGVVGGWADLKVGGQEGRAAAGGDREGRDVADTDDERHATPSTSGRAPQLTSTEVGGGSVANTPHVGSERPGQARDGGGDLRTAVASLADPDSGRLVERDSDLGSVPIIDPLGVGAASDAAGARRAGRQDARAGGGDEGEVRRWGAELERGGGARVPNTDSAGSRSVRGRLRGDADGRRGEGSGEVLADADGGGYWGPEDGRGVGRLDRADARSSREWERARAVAEHRGSADVTWGDYEAAVRRWEHTLGRVAPAPAVDERLSARFVEWMMGLPAGWVTDGPITWREKLKALGNGVVPQQLALALRVLLGGEL